MNTNKLFLAVFLSFLMVTAVFAIDNKKIDNVKYDQIEETLLAGIESSNKGLVVSSAQILGELNSDKAVIPLMKILHSNINDETKIAAALSLYKIGDARGIFAVKQAAKYDDSERVRKMCGNFYVSSLNQNN